MLRWLSNFVAAFFCAHSHSIHVNRLKRYIATIFSLIYGKNSNKHESNLQHIRIRISRWKSKEKNNRLNTMEMNRRYVRSVTLPIIPRKLRCLTSFPLWSIRYIGLRWRYMVWYAINDLVKSMLAPNDMKTCNLVSYKLTLTLLFSKLDNILKRTIILSFTIITPR